MIPQHKWLKIRGKLPYLAIWKTLATKIVHGKLSRTCNIELNPLRKVMPQKIGIENFTLKEEIMGTVDEMH